MTLPWIRGIARPSTNNDDLAAQVEELTQEYRRLNGLISGWTKSGGTEPYFDFLRARDGFFDNPPFESVFLLSNAATEIPNNADTAINWTNIQTNTGLVNISTAVNSSRVFMRPLMGLQRQPLLVSVHAGWAQTSTAGSRRIRFATYRTDGSSIGALEMRYKIFEPDFITMEVVGPFGFNSSIGEIRIEAFQDSGSTMSISAARLLLLRFGTGGGLF